jgi:hypothetical protein
MSADFCTPSCRDHGSCWRREAGLAPEAYCDYDYQPPEKAPSGPPAGRPARWRGDGAVTDERNRPQAENPEGGPHHHNQPGPAAEQVGSDSTARPPVTGETWEARAIRLGWRDPPDPIKKQPDPWRERFAAYGFGTPEPTGQSNGQPTAPGEVDERERAYALGALASEAAALASTCSGRNDRLNVAAYTLSAFVNTGALTRDEVQDALTEAGRAASPLGDHPFTDNEIRATLASGLGSGGAHGLARCAPDDGQVVEVDASELGGGATDSNGEPAQTPVYADHILSRSALRELPDPEPLIDDVLDQGTAALLYGHRGTYKTFIAQDWGASVATGRNWQGRRTEQRRVLYVAAEGAFGFKGRLDAWEVGWHTEIADGQLDILPHPVNLTRRADVANLCALVDWGGYGLVVLDTLARCMVGADENSAKDVGIVVDNIYRLLDRTPGRRGVITGIHHTGKDGRTLRGSSAFEDGVDTVYAVARDGAVVTLDREKRKDGPEIDRHELKLDLIEGTCSAVISVHRGVDKSDRADRLLSTFVHHFAGIGATKAELRLVAEMPPATFHRALSDLLNNGDLVNTGTDKRPFYKALGK